MNQLQRLSAVERLSMKGCVESRRCARHDFEGHLSGHHRTAVLAVAKQGLQIDSLEVLHDDGALSVDGRQVLHAHDVAVVKQPEHPPSSRERCTISSCPTHFPCSSLMATTDLKLSPVIISAKYTFPNAPSASSFRIRNRRLGSMDSLSSASGRGPHVPMRSRHVRISEP